MTAATASVVESQLRQVPCALVERVDARRWVLLKFLTALFRSHSRYMTAHLTFLKTDTSDRVLEYLRIAPSGERIAVILHTGREARKAAVHLPASPIEVLKSGGASFADANEGITAELLPFGYLNSALARSFCVGCVNPLRNNIKQHLWREIPDSVSAVFKSDPRKIQNIFHGYPPVIGVPVWLAQMFSAKTKT